MIAEWSTYRQEGNRRTGSHSIEIIDTQGSNAGTFDIDFEQGFVLTDGGKPKDRWATIKPKSLRFTMKVTTQAHKALARNIGTSTDISRFIIIYRRGARPAFVGIILTEATTLIENRPFLVNGVETLDGIFSITAVDGITLLQNQQFSIFPSTFRRKFNTYWFFNIFRDMPTKPYLVGAPFLFQTSWVPDTGTANFLESQTLAHDAFNSFRLNGNRFISKWDLLMMFCEHFNMSCQFQYGFYVFRQLEDLEAPAYQYNQAFQYIGTNNLVSYVQDLETDMLNMMSPEVTTWEPPIASAKVIYKADFNPNLLLGNKFDLSLVSSYCYNDISTVTVKTSLERIRVIGSIEFTPKLGSYTGLLRVVFYFTIKVGSNYYVRDITNTDWYLPTYGAPQWQASAGNYYQVYDQLIVLPDENLRKFYIPVYFSSLRLELPWDDDNFSMCFGWEAYGFDESTPGSEFGYQLLTKAEVDIEAYLQDLDVSILDSENNLVEPVERVVELPGLATNLQEVERTIYFSSGPNSGSASRITDDSTPPNDTENWTVPKLGTDLHYNILVKSLLARGLQATTFMETVVEGPYQDIALLNACGATWLWWGGQYYIDQQQEYHKGEFMQLSIDAPSSSIIENDKYDIVERPPTPTKALGGAPPVVEREVTGITGNTINADTYSIPMPDTTGWTDLMIRSIVTYNAHGNPGRYKDPPTIQNEFAWDNANRNFVLAENSRAHLWHVFRVYTTN